MGFCSVIDDGTTSLAVENEGNEDYFVVEMEMQPQIKGNGRLGLDEVKVKVGGWVVVVAPSALCAVLCCCIASSSGAPPGSRWPPVTGA